MPWKISKRQTKLKRQLNTANQMRDHVLMQLDHMLLKILHNNGVYTPDDFHYTYVKRDLVRDGFNPKSLSRGYHGYTERETPYYNIHSRSQNMTKSFKSDQTQAINSILNTLTVTLSKLRLLINKRFF